MTNFITATIGNFDGVHLGHQNLFAQLNEFASEKNQKSCVITFINNLKFSDLENKKNLLLLTNEEKEQKILLQVDMMSFLIDLGDLKNTTAESFIKNILKSKGVNSLVVGENFRFGKDRDGDIALLKKHFGDKNVRVANLFEHNGVQCSSTIIRNLLQNGEIERANELLGYQYFIQGRVLKGEKIAGPMLGFPTINIINEVKILPKFGVYEVLLNIRNKKKIEKYVGIANIGVKPTLAKKKQPIIEVHIKDFSKDIYGKNVKIEFLRFVREEKKFDNMDELKKQIQKDVSEVFA